VERLPVAKKVFPEMVYLYSIQDARAEYDIIRASHKSLRMIAHANARGSHFVLHVPTTIKVFVSQDGPPIISRDRLFRALDDAPELWRLRECESCLRLFWAGRVSIKTCATRCAKTIRQKRWREKKFEYEAARADKENKAARAVKKGPTKHGKRTNR
jgi:hypothetical protein